MSTADKLLSLIYSWIEKRERCAKQLRTLAKHLETSREISNAGELFGSTTSVLGAACMIGAFLATGGAAAPVLGGLGAFCTGVGSSISVGSKILDAGISNDAMNEAKEVEKTSNEIVDEIQQLFDKLRAEVKAENPSANPDELNQCIMSKILTSMAKTSGVKGEVRIRWFNGKPELFLTERLILSGVKHGFSNLKFQAVCGVYGLYRILPFFKCQFTGKKYELLLTEAGKQVAQRMSMTAAKTVLKGSAKVVGGYVLMKTAYNEAAESWTNMIENNYVTEASQSIRDTADSIQKDAQTLREQLDSIKKKMDEMAKCQQEQEEMKKKRNQQLGGGDPGGKKRDSEDENSSSEEIVEEPLRMVSLNIQSIMTCRNNISGLTYEGHVVFMTETWLQPDTGDKILKQCLWCRKDFQFFQKARETRGGGVAVLFSGALEAQQIDSSSNTSFEYLVALMRHKTWKQPILTITLYRQPGHNVTGFLEELKRLLDKFSNYKSIIVTGDFNIWVDDETKEPVRRFKQFLEDNGLRQHVKQPTHPSGHTLDLVISRNVEVFNVSVRQNVISDHYKVLFNARPLSKHTNEKKNKKRMNQDNEEGQIKKRKK